MTRQSDAYPYPGVTDMKKPAKWRGRLAIAAATYFAVVVASMVTEMIALATQGVPFDWQWNTGGFIGFASAVAMGVWCRSWASWRKWVWLPVGIMVVFGFIAVNIMMTIWRTS